MDEHFINCQQRPSLVSEEAVPNLGDDVKILCPGMLHTHDFLDKRVPSFLYYVHEHVSSHLRGFQIFPYSGLIAELGETLT